MRLASIPMTETWLHRAIHLVLVRRTEEFEVEHRATGTKTGRSSGCSRGRRGRMRDAQAADRFASSAAVVDITDLKRAEEARLRESEQQLQDIRGLCHRRIFPA